MELDIGKQALLLAAAFALGLGLGLVYDILRPPRSRKTGLRVIIVDAIFCAVAGSTVFMLSMAAGGKLGQWELASAFAGFLAYMWLFSPQLSDIFMHAYSVIIIAGRKLEKNLKKIFKSIKICFKKLWDCFIIRKNRHPNA